MRYHHAVTLNQHQFQLPLFASGSEVKKMLNMSYDMDNGASYDTHRRTSGGGVEPYRTKRKDPETMDDMWDRKLEESKSYESDHGAGVYGSLKKEGWRSHSAGLTMVHRTTPEGVTRRLHDGHHRVASAAALEEEGHSTVWIPLNHRNEV